MGCSVLKQFGPTPRITNVISARVWQYKTRKANSNLLDQIIMSFNSYTSQSTLSAQPCADTGACSNDGYIAVGGPSRLIPGTLQS